MYLYDFIYKIFLKSYGNGGWIGVCQWLRLGVGVRGKGCRFTRII